MKKCFIMLICLVLMILVAARTKKTNVMISNGDVAEYTDPEILLTENPSGKNNSTE